MLRFHRSQAPDRASAIFCNHVVTVTYNTDLPQAQEFIPLACASLSSDLAHFLLGGEPHDQKAYKALIILAKETVDKRGATRVRRPGPRA